MMTPYITRAASRVLPALVGLLIVLVIAFVI